MPPRTYLFVPGSRPERFEKAWASDADAVVLDLEDAVAPDDKSRARDAVCEFLSRIGPAGRERAVVRINDLTSLHAELDLQALRRCGTTQVMLAKAESTGQVLGVCSALHGARVLALIESARGLACVDSIAATPGVSRLVFGTLDFALDLDMDIESGTEGLSYAASRIAVASRAAGLASPVAGVTPELDDDRRLLADLTQARRFGFGAKLCIHPKQVAPLHRAMQPPEASIAWARRVLAAEAVSPGAAQVDGRMVDRPVVLQAERTLARSGQR